MRIMKILLHMAVTKSSSFVPAESAELGITDKILVKSNAQDSVSQVAGCSPWPTRTNF